MSLWAVVVFASVAVASSLCSDGSESIAQNLVQCAWLGGGSCCANSTANAVAIGMSYADWSPAQKPGDPCYQFTYAANCQSVCGSADVQLPCQDFCNRANVACADVTLAGGSLVVDCSFYPTTNCFNTVPCDVIACPTSSSPTSAVATATTTLGKSSEAGVTVVSGILMLSSVLCVFVNLF